MSIIPKFLQKRNPFFTVSWAADSNKLLHWIALDRQNPLHIASLRAVAARTQTGLFWQIHAGVQSTARKSCVRTWARRRLRNALCEELKERGIDKEGQIVQKEAFRKKYGWGNSVVLQALEEGARIELKGSVSILAREPVIAAEYAQVRRAMSDLVDGLVNGLHEDMRLAQNTREGVRREQNGKRSLQLPSPAAFQPRIREIMENRTGKRQARRRSNHGRLNSKPPARDGFRLYQPTSS